MIANIVNLGKGATLAPVQRLLADWYLPLCDAISAEKVATGEGIRDTDRKIYGPLFSVPKLIFNGPGDFELVSGAHRLKSR